MVSICPGLLEGIPPAAFAQGDSDNSDIPLPIKYLYIWTVALITRQKFQYKLDIV